ncbi:MAG: amidohydrolase family protein [Sedimentisphaerales bacterium]|nr:amidohydrolase family protein [Sedimentisphaerales bacterium]
MIIDCHSHIWPSRSCLGQAQKFSCLAAACDDKSNRDRSFSASETADATFILGFVSRHLNAEIPNSYIKNHLASQPHRLFGFAGIDPADNDAAAEIRRLHDVDGFVGFTLSPACQAFHPCDTRALALYEVAQELSMPIYFLSGMALPQNAYLEFAQPDALDEIARDFPELKIVISHLGYPRVEQTIAMLAKHPNIFADVAGLTKRPLTAYRHLTLAYECGVIEKLLFGTDSPCYNLKDTVEALYYLNKITLDSVLPVVPREQLRSIIERDSLTLLGLKSSELTSVPGAESTGVPETTKSTPSTYSAESEVPADPAEHPESVDSNKASFAHDDSDDGQDGCTKKAKGETR